MICDDWYTSSQISEAQVGGRACWWGVWYIPATFCSAANKLGLALASSWTRWLYDGGFLGHGGSPKSSILVGCSIMNIQLLGVLIYGTPPYNVHSLARWVVFLFVGTSTNIWMDIQMSPGTLTLRAEFLPSENLLFLVFHPTHSQFGGSKMYPI